MTCLAALNTAVANPITEHRAREIASRFMLTHSAAPRLSSTRPTIAVTPTTQQAAYYIFNAGTDDGFVIVAGDDRLPPVLGYSDSGSFDDGDVPPALQEWLEGYAAQVEAIAAGARPEERSASRTKQRAREWAKVCVMGKGWGGDGEGSPHPRSTLKNLTSEGLLDFS